MSGAGLVGFAVLAAGSDCGDSVAPQVTQRVHGFVVLGGTQTDELGAAILERIVTDASGVRVELVPERAGDTVQVAFSDSGRFEFASVPEGTWRARVAVDPQSPVESSPFAVAGAPVEIDEPLVVASSAELVTYPNPFDPTTGVGLEVANGPGGRVEYAILTLGLETVWSGSLDGNAPGYFHVHWGGGDLAGPPGLYWAVLRDANGVHTDLVFKNE